MNGPLGKLSRCAIYTRKSTEHNLDLAFTSLDAQREACEAYITSQAGEGWRRSDSNSRRCTTPSPTVRLVFRVQARKKKVPTSIREGA